jgi:hypothetical protein
VARIREYEEIIDLQEKAIEALKQAATVLQQALYTLEKARAEHGYQQQIPWNEYYQQPQQYQYWHNSQPYALYPNVNNGNGVFYSGGMNVNNAGNAQLTSPKENFDYVPETIFKY